MFQKSKIFLPAINSISVIVALFLNYLAVSMPLNNKTTGELSDAYPNYFVPAGFTFAIWGIIYLQLLLFTLYQWYCVWKPSVEADSIISGIGLWFCLSCIANAGWIVAWHYEFIIMSLIIMLVLFYSLYKAYLAVSHLRPLNFVNNSVCFLMLSVYLGWISVATIANVTALLVSKGFTEGIISAPLWATTVIIIAGILGTFMIYRNQDIGYAAVIMWALYGIYSRHAAGGDYTSETVATTARYIMTFLLIYIALSLIGRKWYLIETRAKESSQS